MSSDRMVAPLLAELEQEAIATERMLERVPAEKLSWRPQENAIGHCERRLCRCMVRI